MGSATSNALIQEENFPELKKKLNGKLLLPGDSDYEAARKIWNGMIDKRPAVIIQCKNENDVTEAVGLAKRLNVSVSVKAGGHNISGNAVCDGGVMIDLSGMKSISVDPVRKVAVTEAGVTWKEFDAATQQFGLATTGGIVSSTGVAGLTLGGGVGWLVRKHGMSCDNLVEASVITADANRHKVNSYENNELFWGIRGGGGNFGVVTSMTFALHPVSTVLGGMIIYPLERATEVIRFYRDFMRSAPEELTMYTALMTSPEGAPIVVMLGCYTGEVEKGKEVMRPVREFGTPLADLMQPMPYLQMQTIVDAGFPHGNRYYWKSTFLKELSDEAIEILLAHVSHISSPHSAVVIEYYGGAASREPQGGASYPHRQNEFDLVIISNWTDVNEDEKHVSWTRNLYNAMQPFSSHRVYVNTLGIEGPDRVKEAYGENYERLKNVKLKYDPDNMFCFNQNIPA